MEQKTINNDNYDPWQALVEAIIIRAAKDYNCNGW